AGCSTMRYALVVVFLVVLALTMPQSTRAEDCSAAADERERMQCFTRNMVAQSMCLRMLDEASRAECVRARQLDYAMSSLCDTEALKNDRVACLEAKVIALTRELAELRQAMLPRLHQ